MLEGGVEPIDRKPVNLELEHVEAAGNRLAGEALVDLDSRVSGFHERPPLSIRVAANLKRLPVRGAEVERPMVAIQPVQVDVNEALVEPDVGGQLVEWAGVVVVEALTDEIARIAVHGQRTGRILSYGCWRASEYRGCSNRGGQ